MNAAKQFTSAIPRNAYLSNLRRWQAMMAELAKLSGINRREIEDSARTRIRAATGGNESSKALTPMGWAHLFVWLEEQLAKYKPGSAPVQLPEKNDPAAAAKPPKVRRNPDALISGQQRQVIVTLCDLNEMPGDDIKKFCREQFGWDLPSTRAKANKVINALKPMALRRHRVAERVAALIEIESVLDPADRDLLRNVHAALAKGKQGASVKVGVLPILLKIFARYERRLPE